MSGRKDDLWLKANEIMQSLEVAIGELEGAPEQSVVRGRADRAIRELEEIYTQIDKNNLKAMLKKQIAKYQRKLAGDQKPMYSAREVRSDVMYNARSERSAYKVKRLGTMPTAERSHSTGTAKRRSDYNGPSKAARPLGEHPHSIAKHIVKGSGLIEEDELTYTTSDVENTNASKVTLAKADTDTYLGQTKTGTAIVANVHDVDEVQPNIRIKEIRFVWSDVINRSGEGVVYRALYKGQFVALKIFNALDRADHARYDKRYRRMLVEMNNTRLFRHPNVLKYYGWARGRDATQTDLVYIYQVMELGICDLKGVVSGGFAALRPELKRYFIEALRGLGYLHRNKIIHSDLKPANVIIVRDEKTGNTTAKLCDFGMSLVGHEATFLSSKHESIFGTVIGYTPLYSAPEALTVDSQGKKHVTSKSDIFSMGGVAYYLAMGREPIPQGLGEIEDLLRRGKTAPLERVVDPFWRKVIERCWRQDPDTRPGADELADMCERLLYV